MNKLLGMISKDILYKANVPLLMKAMLAGKSIGFHDVAGRSHHGIITGIRAEGGKGMWLINTKKGEFCVRCQEGEFSALSQWAI